MVARKGAVSSAFDYAEPHGTVSHKGFVHEIRVLRAMTESRLCVRLRSQPTSLREFCIDQLYFTSFRQTTHLIDRLQSNMDPAYTLLYRVFTEELRRVGVWYIAQLCYGSPIFRFDLQAMTDFERAVWGFSFNALPHIFQWMQEGKPYHALYLALAVCVRQWILTSLDFWVLLQLASRFLQVSDAAMWI